MVDPGRSVSRHLRCWGVRQSGIVTAIYCDPNVCPSHPSHRHRSFSFPSSITKCDEILLMLRHLLPARKTATPHWSSTSTTPWPWRSSSPSRPRGDEAIWSCGRSRSGRSGGREAKGNRVKQKREGWPGGSFGRRPLLWEGRAHGRRRERRQPCAWSDVETKEDEELMRVERRRDRTDRRRCSCK